MDKRNGSSRFTAKQVTRPRAQVEQQIREAILAGQFSPGDKLPPETQLAEQFGVSRPTVREALGSLVSAGLIRKVPGVAGGSFVNSVTTASLSQTVRESVDIILRLGALDIEEITVVRQIIEVPAAGMAADNRTLEHIERMQAVVERQRTTTIDDPDIPSYDLAFHTAVGDASGNRLLGAFVRALHSSTSPATYLEVTPQVARKTVKQHIAIAAAIEAGNAEGAEEAMEEHLEYVLRYSTNCSWLPAR
jgi:GntR family transcriptional regulator, transcriptional repressor for pyruvate dehydrogenase complex